MRAANRLAIAKLAVHHREHMVAIRPYGPGLAVHTLFYEAEVRSLDLNLADVDIAATPRWQECPRDRSQW